MDLFALAAILAGGAALAALFSAFDDDDGSTGSSTETPDDDTDGGTGTDDGSGNDIAAEGSTYHDWQFVVHGAGTLAGVSNPASPAGFYSVNRDHTFSGLESGEQDVTVDSLPGLTEVEAGVGDDSITVTGHDVLVYSSRGDDTIDASGLGSGLIQASSGDSVQGSDLPDADVIVLGSDYTFAGGAAGEYAFSGDYARASGGGGDDTLIAGGEGSLSGGDGNDVLDGKHGRMLEADVIPPSDLFSYHSNDAANRLDGGAGNDTISFDYGDTVTGGGGADSLIGYAAPGQDSSVVADFDPAEDSLRLWVDQNADSVTLQAIGGDTQILMNGEVISLIQGQTNLTAGYLLDATDGNTTLVDANGNQIDASDVNIIIGNYPSTPS